MKLEPLLIPVPASVAPAPTFNAPEPVAEPLLLLNCNAPEVTVVPPVKVFEPVRARVPVPPLVRLKFVPDPEPPSDPE